MSYTESIYSYDSTDSLDGIEALGSPIEAIDVALRLEDLYLPTDSSDNRPTEALNHIMLAGGSEYRRIAHRPQPAKSEVLLPGISILGDDVDCSWSYLLDDACDLSFLTAPIPRLYLGIQFPCDKTNFLTYLDAFEAWPADEHTVAMTCRVAVIRKLLENFEEHKDEYVGICVRDDSVDQMTLQCRLLTYLSRLLFYRARFEGRSCVVLRADMINARIQLGLSSDYNVLQQGYNCRNDIFDRIVALRNRALSDGVIDRIEGPIIVDSAFTAAPGNSEVECAICLTGETGSMALTVLCKHAFCKECLETWTDAPQNTSYRCLACRTHLSLQVEYIQRTTLRDEDFDLGRELAVLQAMEDFSRRAEEEAGWLEAGMQLQERYETLY